VLATTDPTGAVLILVLLFISLIFSTSTFDRAFNPPSFSILSTAIRLDILGTPHHRLPSNILRIHSFSLRVHSFTISSIVS
jgi:hypothetical protein